MALPVRPRSDAAPRPQQNRVRYDVVPSSASSDPFLEFLPEKPEIFIIVPVPSEPPSYAAQGWPHDQILSRSQDITADVGLFRTLFRRVLSLPRRAVVATFLTLHHGMMGTLLALRRVVVGTFLALHHGVLGTLLALRRVMVRTLLALRHRLVGTLQTLHHRVMGTLLALRRSVVRILLALHRGVVATSIVARRTTSEGARWARRSWAGVIAGTISIRISGVSRFRRLAGDVRTLARFMSMVGHDLSVVGSSLRGRMRDAQRIAIANLGVRGPLSRLRISRLQVPATNVKLVAFAGGTAVCALAAWMFVQPNLPRLNDRTARSGAPAPGVVASKRSADDSVKTIDTAGSGTGSGNQQSITPSSVSASTVVMPPAMTVTSTPAGARVTVNGIGWGETPVTIRHLPPGQKVVRVTKEGYESQQRVIRVPDDPRSAAVRVRLRARS
jgi:hypothetical protein